MALNITDLVQKMSEAAMNVLGKQLPEIKDYVESECKKLGECILTIERMHVEGKITLEQAKLHLDIQKNAMRTVLLTAEGLGILAAEQAINAALNIVKDAVNSALGFTLI